MLSVLAVEYRDYLNPLGLSKPLPQLHYTDGGGSHTILSVSWLVR